MHHCNMSSDKSHDESCDKPCDLPFNALSVVEILQLQALFCQQQNAKQFSGKVHHFKSSDVSEMLGFCV